MKNKNSSNYFIKLRQRCSSLRDWGKSKPSLVEKGVDFRFKNNIFLGENVSFLKGAMVYSDKKGQLTIGDSSTICRYSVIQTLGGSINIGKRVLIGDFCSLYGQGRLVIGDDTMIAAYTMIATAEHVFKDRRVTISSQQERKFEVKIGSDVWIGGRVSILAGVTIGDGCVIGAGSVVTRDIPAFSICVGVPARVIKKR